VLLLVLGPTGTLSKTAMEASRLHSLTPSSWMLQLQPWWAHLRVALTAAHRPLIWDRRMRTPAAQAKAALLLLVMRRLMMAHAVARSAGHPGEQ
jgi:hypothetical protein